jgi:hypothetical protein
METINPLTEASSTKKLPLTEASSTKKLPLTEASSTKKLPLTEVRVEVVAPPIVASGKSTSHRERIPFVPQDITRKEDCYKFYEDPTKLPLERRVYLRLQTRRAQMIAEGVDYIVGPSFTKWDDGVKTVVENGETKVKNFIDKIPSTRDIMSDALVDISLNLIAQLSQLLFFQCLVGLTAMNNWGNTLLSVKFVILVIVITGSFLGGAYILLLLGNQDIETMSKTIIYYELLKRNVVVDWKNKESDGLFWFRHCKTSKLHNLAHWYLYFSTIFIIVTYILSTTGKDGLSTRIVVTGSIFLYINQLNCSLSEHIVNMIQIEDRLITLSNVVESMIGERQLLSCVPPS